MSKLDVVKSLSPRGAGAKHDPETFYNFEGNTLVGVFPKSKGESSARTAADVRC